jgi:hypothetical protein
MSKPIRRGQLGSTLACATALALAAAAAAQGPPRPSPGASVSGTAGVTDITIEYSRPGVKGRQIWGGLVPYDQIWRTGANEATTITISTDVNVEGKPLAAGTYALFTIPGREKWTVVFNKQGKQWGAFEHDAAQDALRVEVAPREAPFQERMAFTIPEVTETSAVVELRWEKLSLPFTLTMDTPRLAAELAAKETSAPDATGTTFARWARWGLESGTAIDQAVGWAAKSVQGEGAKSYWSGSVHARLLAKNGKAAEARAEAERVLAIVTDDSIPEMKADAARLRDELAEWSE